MAVFQANNISLPYQIVLAPFEFDLVLLQNSSFGSEFWQPVLEDLKHGDSQGGRVLTCDWAEIGAAVDRAKHFMRLLQTLGFHRTHVIAFNDAVAFSQSMQKVQSEIFEKTLFFPHSGPKGEDLISEVREFCEL